PQTSPLSSCGLADTLDKVGIDVRCCSDSRPRSHPEVTLGLFRAAGLSDSTLAFHGGSGSQATHSVVFSQTPSGGYGVRIGGGNILTWRAFFLLQYPHHMLFPFNTI